MFRDKFACAPRFGFLLRAAGNRDFSWKTTPLLHFPINLAGPDYLFGKVVYQTVGRRGLRACTFGTVKRETLFPILLPFLAPVWGLEYQTRLRGVLP